MQKERKITVHQTMFPLLIMNILENHATKDHPLTITEITDFINREFAPFAMERDNVVNRSTVMRILFNFHVVQCGTDGKKMFCLER